MFELDTLAAAILATVICVNAAPARADVLDDLFGAPAPQKGSSQVAWEECGGNRTFKNIAQDDRFIACLNKHPNAAHYTLDDRAYILRMQQTSLAVHAGADFKAMMIEENAWRVAQLQETQNRNAQLAAQARTANAIESIPLQQAHWAVTIGVMNSMGRGYTPRMSTTNY